MADYIIPPIRSLIVLLTNQCNLACPYCFESRDAQRMSFDTAKAVLRFLHKNSKSPNFTFFGGEPCLEWDTIIVPLVEHAKTLDNPTRFGMTTNGTLLNKERVDFLMENNINFMISMDGNKETQDCLRPCKNKRSSFDMIMDTLPYILSKKSHQEVHITLNKQNSQTFFEDILWFEDMGIKGVIVAPNFYEALDDEYVSYLDDQVKKYEDYIITSFAQEHKPLLMREYRDAFERVFSSLYAAERRTSSVCAPTKQCGFGVRGNGSCDVFGNIYGCHRVELDPNSMWCIGNIYDGIDENRVKVLVNSYDPQMVRGENCSTCPLDKVCNGGCVSNNWLVNGDMHKVPELFCYWTRLITDSAYRICKALGIKGREDAEKLALLMRR